MTHISFIVHVRLNQHLQPIAPIRGLPFTLGYETFRRAYKDFVPPSLTLSLGPKDARAFTWDNETCLLFSAIPTDDALLRVKNDHRITSVREQMYVQCIHPVVRAPVVLMDGDHVYGQTAERHWCAIGEVTSKNGSVEYLFARFVNPHQIYQCNKLGRCVMVGSTHNDFINMFMHQRSLHAMHLGTNAVAINSTHMLAFMHGLRPSPRAKFYLNIAYVFEAQAPWRIVQVSDKVYPLPVDVPVKTINGKTTGDTRFRFATSLAYVDGKLIMGYGVEDSNPRFHVLELSHVIKHMLDTGRHVFREL